MRKRRPKSLFFFWDRLSITHKSDMLLPRIIFCISTALACQRIEEDTLFDLCHVFPCRYDGIGVDRDGIDAALDQEFSEVRIDARCLAADGNGLAVLMGYGNEMADSPFDCQVAFIEERCYRIVVAVAAHDEHGQVVGADGIAIDELVELVGQDDIGRDFSHYPIAANDDAIRGIELLTSLMADAVAEGLLERSGKAAKAEGETEQPMAAWEKELLTEGAPAADAPAEAEAEGEAKAE